VSDSQNTGWLPPSGDKDRDRGAAAAGIRRVGRVTSRAQEYVRDPQRLVRLVEDAARASEERPVGRVGELVEDMKALLRMTMAYARGQYRDIPRDKLLLAVGAIAYFLSPFDVIPEFLGPLGFSDDALVLGLLLRLMREEVGRFLDWESQHADPPAAEVIDISSNGGSRRPQQ
jgi:uncharacterized membrane protein YkvA (DUF1232 family)